MKELAQIASAVQVSSTMAIDALAKQMKADGVDVIGFGAGEPDFNTPDHIKAAADRAIAGNLTRYTPASGTLALKEAVCQRMREDCGVEYKPSQVVVSTGAKHCVYLALRALVNPGDEVILPAPYWVSYLELIKMVGGRPVVVSAGEKDGFKITAEQLAAAITPKTKALILNNPGNPTGMVYHREELEAIARVCVEHDLYVISDEVYYGLMYDGEPFVSAAALGRNVKDRVILVNGVSKSYAMTGWRLGWVMAPKEMLQPLVKIHQFGIMSAPTVSQFAGIEAMRTGKQDIKYMREQYDMRRRFMYQRLQEIGMPCFEPEGAFYIFPSIQNYMEDDEAFCDQLLRKKKVAVVPGSAFGESGRGHVRISYSYSMMHLETAMERIEEFIQEL